MVDGYLNSPSTLTVVGGKLSGANGTILGPVVVAAGGTLAPGETNVGVGPLYIQNNTLVLANGSTTSMRVEKTGLSIVNDAVQNATSVTYGGTLVVTAAGDPLTNGDIVTLFPSAGSYHGGFTNYSLPTLPYGQLWDTSYLATDGSLRVVNTAPAPVFTPPGGGYVSPVSVTISSATNAIIYYTTDGSAPDTNSPHGPSPITGIVVPADTAGFTIRAYAAITGYGDSAPATAVYQTTPVPTWLTAGSGSWATAGNWSNNVVGNGSSATVDLSAVSLFGDAAITLDGSWTLGHLLIGDAGTNYNWTISPGTPAGTLTLDATNTPTVTVLSGTNTINAVLAGTNGLAKLGNGMLSLTTNNTYSGGTTVSNGTLNLVGPNDANSRIGAGLLTVNSGATVTAGTNNPLGWGDARTPSLNVNGGTVDCAGFYLQFQTLTMTGGTMTRTNNNWISYGDVAITASATGSTIAGGAFQMRFDTSGNISGTRTFTVADGPATTDLTVSSRLVNAGGGTSGLQKSGFGTMVLTATNTYTGPTTISNGVLMVNGSLAAASYVTNSPTGTLAGTGTVAGPLWLFGTLAPGANAVGTLTTGPAYLYGGSTILCKVAGADPANTAARDFVNINGTLYLDWLTNGVATIKLVSMLNSNTPGNVPDFNPASNYVWTVAGATNASIGGNAGFMSRLQLDLSAFSNPHGGSFALVPNLSSNSLEIHYTAAVATLPLVSLSSPTNSQYFNAPAILPLAVSVTANGHTIDSVTYYTNGVAATPALGSPFSTSLAGVPAGAYNTWAVASYDSGAGTVNSPTNSIFVLGVLNITSKARVAGGNFQVSFTGPVGQSFSVRCTNVVNAPFAQWPVLTNGTIGGGGAVTFTDTNAPASGRQFYRIVSP
jgi:autotransporter-associated beta strand protein